MPSTTAPGLLKVGDMIKVTQGAVTDWRGLVTSVSIEASLVNTADPRCLTEHNYTGSAE